ncbi:MAG: CocE/NonD family hydrolase [Bryobacteraceae bacterium]|nr:CocE/NonD family hydrolase [Bryobacteraceae bacterium]
MNLPSTCLFLFAAALAAQQNDPAAEVKANYTKYEYRIPVRDGKRLFTSVYMPKDLSKSYPILLSRTPYSVRPYGADQYRAALGPSDFFRKAGYIFVYQDVRGRYKSEGEFEQIRPRNPGGVDETTDTWDTVEWLVKNLPNNNGRVGVWGISYPGFYTSTAMIDAHPAIKAVSPQAPVGDWFIGDDFHHNGAFYLAHAFRWFWSNSRTGADAKPNAERINYDYPTPDGYDLFLSMGTLPEINERLLKHDVPFWKDLMTHGTYDSFWQARNVRQHLKNIKPAVMTVGGWFDAEDLFGAVETYRSVEKGSPGGFNILVMGPWHHGGWSSTDGRSLGHLNFAAPTSVFYREKIEFPFFEHFLKDAPDPKLPEAYVFETGANQWRKYDKWPPAGAALKQFYLQPGGGLGAAPPAAAGFDEYVSDPARPVPYIPGIANTMTREHMLDDQRFASTRPDVLVYQTEPLERDVTFTGPLEASLHVSTTGTDADWVVKLIDVYPPDYPDPSPNPAGVKMGGYQQLVRGEPFRGKFRNSFEKPEPFSPGKVTRVVFAMPDVFHTFRSGHRIMVQIQSSWFPLVDRNPQKFVDIYNARKDDFQKAVHRVHRSPGAASAIAVRVLE